MINPEDRLPRRIIDVAGRRTSLVDVGIGPAVLFLHGNVGYSYSWRNVVPFLSHVNRCIVPDLVGMGGSEVVVPSGPGAYRFEDLLDQVELLIEIVAVDGPMVVVGHELGGALAIEIARRHSSFVSGIALIEGVFRSTNQETFDDDVAEFLETVRGEAGEEMVLRQNALVEFYLPRLTSRRLIPQEMDAYRAPYTKVGEARRAMLSLIRQLPLRNSPGNLAERIEQNRLWSAQSQVPKLVIGGTPGFLIPPAVLGTTARWANSSVASVRGLHFLLEDSPARITALLLDWLEEIGHIKRPG